MPSPSKNLAILVGGGPAPGVNSVIGAASIRAIMDKVNVIGIEDGFKWIMQGDVSRTVPLTIERVSRIHFRGGSYIGISRDNPTKQQETLNHTVVSLLRLDVDKLITIGGDDTAYSAMRLEEVAAGRIRVVHVPKTIDNDLALPHGQSTFGYQTARHLGVELIKNLMVDAATTSRWYFVITMGRKAGHLALGIGKAAGATLTLVPEEFRNPKISLAEVTDVLAGAIIKRMSHDRPEGVAVIAEGIAERMDPAELASLQGCELDEYGNIRHAEVNFGTVLKQQVQERLAEFGLKVTIVSKNIGYELRCADPIPFDLEYTRDLGFCASQHLLDGGNAAIVSLQNGRFNPLPFSDMIDPETGRMKVRLVDAASESYCIARNYMLRLNRADFDDPRQLAKYAAICGIGLERFREEFSYLLGNEPPQISTMMCSARDLEEGD
jgi:6-phosphofructokinase 1